MSAAESAAVVASEPYNIDADVRNADWVKRTWDLPRDSALPWLRAIGVEATTPEPQALVLITRGLRAPSAAAMPPDVVSDLIARYPGAASALTASLTADLAAARTRRRD